MLYARELKEVWGLGFIGVVERTPRQHPMEHLKKK